MGYIAEVLEVKQTEEVGSNRGASVRTKSRENMVVVANPGHADNVLRVLGSQLESGDTDWTVIADPITNSTDNLPVAIYGAWARICMETYAYTSGTPSARVSSHDSHKSGA